MVRVATAGSVDDGKSTLIGRLLLDSKSLMSDQLDHVEEASRRRGFGRTELALLTDGLRAEREQGITIDVAWRYFATADRRFILADTPGHVQYTRNMVTGASTADVAIVLLDAERGATDQTRRHLFIAALLGVPRILLAVNKMDRVAFDRARFDALAGDARGWYQKGGGLASVLAVPLSALRGDNVVDRSGETPWYTGPTLMEALHESVTPPRVDGPARFPVQWVIRPQDEAHHDYRGLAGRLLEGTLAIGDPVVVLPAGLVSKIARLESSGQPCERVLAGESIVVQLADDLDVSRGDLVCALVDPPASTETLELDVCWLSPAILKPGARLTVKHTTRRVKAIVESIVHRRDVTDGGIEPVTQLGLNDLGRIRLRLAGPVCVAPYATSRALGSVLLIDEASADTVGAAMVR